MSCKANNHHFVLPKKTTTATQAGLNMNYQGYYKKNLEGKTDFDKVFVILYCDKCANTAEICIIDRTPKG